MVMKTNLYSRAIRVVVGSFLTLLVGCSASEKGEETSGVVSENVRTDVCQYVIDKLNEHRVVMIGDSHHGQGLYGQTVVACLNHWIDATEKADVDMAALPSKLALILELDSIQLAGLHRFFLSGDVCDAMTLSSFVAWQYTTSQPGFPRKTTVAHVGRTREAVRLFRLDK